MIVTKVNSKALRGSTELIVVADIKPGLVQVPDPMSHATRLERFFEALFSQRKRSVELHGPNFVGPLERLRTLHFVHFSLIEERRKLLLVVDFDKPWEPYIRTIVDEAGPILDAIFFHCVGYEQSTSRHGYVAFANWVRERQQNTNFFFAGVPELSAEDARYYAKLKGLHDTGAPNPADYALNARVDAQPPLMDPSELVRTLAGLYRLKGLFPERGEAFDKNANDPEYTDRAFYNRVVRMVAQTYAAPVRAGASQFLAGQYNDFAPWFASVTQVPAFTPPTSTPNPSPNEVQGNILSGYADMTHGAAVLVHFAGKGAAFLNAISVTTEAATGSPTDPKCNVSFTFAGLKALGLPKQILDQLPVEFREGMADRAGPLGDVLTNHPEKWSPPRDVLGATDAVVILEVQDTSATDKGTDVHPKLLAQIDKLKGTGVVVLGIQALRRHATRWDQQTGKYREHFGYLDGFGQPTLPLTASGPIQNKIGYGEILLGYPNDHADQPSDLERSPLLKDGSFLVVRKLAQDVEAFQQFVKEASTSTLSEDTIKAKLMGREPNGLPLATGTTSATIGADWNDFSYSADPAGTGCPFQAHVRLSNPRSPDGTSVHGRPMRVPRITRRGFSYGPEFDPSNPGGERGLFFMAYVANIAEQYEVVQRWLNGANSTGLHSSQNDPITAPVDEANHVLFRFASATGTVTLPPITKPFVTLKWGLYVFAPSATGLGELKKAAASPENPGRAALAGGREILARLRDLETKLPANLVALEWKKILEGQGEREKGVALMATIRVDHGGVLRSPYGVIVGSERVALEVLKDEARFSAREYWRRMKKASIKMHLGMDRVPSPKAVCPPLVTGEPPSDQDFVNDVGAGEYARESFANDLVYGIDRVTAFRGAYALTKGALNLPPPAAGRRTADLFVLAEKVVASLSKEWFGFPDGAVTPPGNVGLNIGGTPVSEGDRAAYCPYDFVVASQFIFRQTPDLWTEELAVKRGAQIQAAAIEYVKANPNPPSGSFLAKLYTASKNISPNLPAADREAQIVRSLVGAIDGFVAANWGAFVSTIGQWTTKGELWRNQLEFESDIVKLAQGALAANSEFASTGSVSQQTKEALSAKIEDSAPFVERVVRSLRLVPLPMWLVRTAIVDTTLGAVSVRPGDRIAIHLGSAALENGSVDMLFGGKFDPKGSKGSGPSDLPHHACPAKDVGIGVLLGMLVATLERKNIVAQSPIALSYDP